MNGRTKRVSNALCCDPLSNLAVIEYRYVPCARFETTVKDAVGFNITDAVGPDSCFHCNPVKTLVERV